MSKSEEEQDLDEQERLRGIIGSGRDLSPREAGKVERSIAANPVDPATFEARCRLLGFYMCRDHFSQRRRSRKAQHIFWMMRNAPRSRVLGWPYAHLDGYTSPRLFERGAQIIIGQAHRDPTDARIAGNVAAYLRAGGDLVGAEVFLNHCEELEPDSSEWPGQLGTLYELMLGDIDKGDPEAKRNMAQRALEAYQRALDRRASDEFIISTFATLCVIAARAGLGDLARRYANEVLCLEQNEGEGRQFLPFVHDPHVALGLVSLDEGNVADAKVHLLEAGEAARTVDSRAFSYDFTLAESLYDIGEEKAVAKYLSLGAQPETERSRFSEFRRYWRRVEAGKPPRFHNPYD